MRNYNLEYRWGNPRQSETTSPGYTVYETPEYVEPEGGFWQQVLRDEHLATFDVRIVYDLGGNGSLIVRGNRGMSGLKLNSKKLELAIRYFGDGRWTQYTEDQVYDIINEILIEKKSMYYIFLENLYNEQNVE